MIEVQNLAKDYGSYHAVRGISFDVHGGEVVGFLGPNGAGKSTTMKMLTCYLAPTAGIARVGGVDVGADPLAVRQQLGYLPEDTPIYPEMTTLEFLEFVAAMRRIPTDRRRKRIRDVAEVCGLFSVMGKLVGELSKGYRQRAGLAQALVHDPAILILDEPTSGLDPNQIVEIRQLIREIGREKTVILSTHILPEVQATCSRVIIIHEGRLVADGTPGELSAQEGEHAYRLLVEAVGLSREQVTEKLQAIQGVKSVSEVDGDDGALGLMVAGESSRDLRRDLFACARDNGWILLELKRQTLSLEDVFRKLTRE
ncbi:MAG: ATP-binding cassette domain-containing protein [Deltaproteobacteria bacterium]|nr:ATP-binding cassette domain-containing protein [Deltaproteobacteria bacterium]